MDVHEFESQIIKEFDRFISIFSINLEFFFVDLNVFRHCSIEVNRDKEIYQVDFLANANDQCTGQLLL